MRYLSKSIIYSYRLLLVTIVISTILSFMTSLIEEFIILPDIDYTTLCTSMLCLNMFLKSFRSCWMIYIGFKNNHSEETILKMRLRHKRTLSFFNVFSYIFMIVLMSILFLVSSANSYIVLSFISIV